MTITVCHDLTTSATLWARHTLWDEVDPLAGLSHDDQIKAKDTGHSRPSFKADGLFDFDVDEFYKTVRSLIRVNQVARRPSVKLLGSWWAPPSWRRSKWRGSDGQVCPGQHLPLPGTPRS